MATAYDEGLTDRNRNLPHSPAGSLPDYALPHPCGACPRGGGCRGWASPYGQGSADGATEYQGHPRHPCHYRATHNSPERSRPDNHGQPRSSLSLRPFASPQVGPAPDLALGAGDRGFKSHRPDHKAPEAQVNSVLSSASSGSSASRSHPSRLSQPHSACSHPNSPPSPGGTKRRHQLGVALPRGSRLGRVRPDQTLTACLRELG
jgi:hypothetical protein